MVAKTPLYYMGGKGKALKYILPYIPLDLDLLISPFMGGGSVEISISERGTQVQGYDKDPNLVAFWQQILKDPDVLADRIKEIGPIDKSAYWRLVELLQEDQSQVELAAIYFVLNRTSFMAQIGVGMSTNPKNNINDSLILRVRDFKCRNLVVEQADFRDVILGNKGAYFYLDPPYFIASKRPYYYPDTIFRSVDHMDLSKLLHKEGKWVLSYDNCPEVRELYKDYRQIFLQWLYNCNKGAYIPKEPKEILILGEEVQCG